MQYLRDLNVAKDIAIKVQRKEFTNTNQMCVKYHINTAASIGQFAFNM